MALHPKIIKLLASVFYLGYAPISGSVASLAGLFMCLFLAKQPFFYVLVFILITVIGFIVSGEMEKIEGKKDPSSVVIDEVAGSFIAFFMLPASPAIFMTAYFLFRAFDMFKIYPADQLENLGGSAGVMCDDLLAGLYTNLIMQIAIHFSGIH